MIATNINKDSVVRDFYWLWPLFCFQAGLINSGGFLACHRFVSHVTGFGTRIGMEFLQQNFLLGLEMLFIPLGFILGCAVSGYLIEVRNFFKIPFWLMSLLLIAVYIFGALGIFGDFGEPLKFQRNFLLLFLLCFTCGLQNGAITSMTAGVVRTTHMTGVATDLGLSLNRLLMGKQNSERPWFNLRMKKIIFFALGATVGTIFFSLFHFAGFAIIAGLNLVLIQLLGNKMRRIRDGVKETYTAHPRDQKGLQSDEDKLSSHHVYQR